MVTTTVQPAGPTSATAQATSFFSDAANFFSNIATFVVNVAHDVASAIDSVQSGIDAVQNFISQTVSEVLTVATYVSDSLHEIATDVVEFGQSITQLSSSITAAWEHVEKLAGDVLSNPFSLSYAQTVNDDLAQLDNHTQIVATDFADVVNDATELNNGLSHFLGASVSNVAVYDAGDAGQILIAEDGDSFDFAASTSALTMNEAVTYGDLTGADTSSFTYDHDGVDLAAVTAVSDSALAYDLLLA